MMAEYLYPNIVWNDLEEEHMENSQGRLNGPHFL